MRSHRKAYGALTLIGVVHRDPQGHELLLDCFQTLRPDALCVEISPWGLTWRERRGASLLEQLDRTLTVLPPMFRKHHQLELIRAAVRLPFEYTASLESARIHNTPVHCVDLNWISRNHLSLYESEILKLENLKALAETDGFSLQEVVERAYRRAVQIVDNPILGFDWNNELDRRRERFLACRVRRLSRIYDRMVYVGGWRHLVEDREGCSVASLLRDLNPRRHLLRHGELPGLAVEGPSRLDGTQCLASSATSARE